MLNLRGKSVVYYSALDRCLSLRYRLAKGKQNGGLSGLSL